MHSGKALRLAFLLGLAFLFAFATPAAAASFEGAQLPLYTGLPFAGLLLSIALGPIFAKRVWHVHYGWAAAAWALLALGMLIAAEGLSPTLTALSHSMFADYLPFILMLFALYTTAGGIVVSDFDRATPRLNTLLLAFGTFASSLIGATGASLIFIRPILQANAKRKHQAHVVIFFIFLVSNIGGILTPLGNPPLFFGFLRGVSFFWPLRTLWPHLLFTASLVLITFYLIDSYFARKDREAQMFLSAEGAPHLAIRGLPNVFLMACVIAAILVGALWHPGVAIDYLGARVELQNLLRDTCLAAIGLLSFVITPQADRAANHFSWEPLEEVAKLFAAIFITIIPVMTMLAANSHGPFAPVIAILEHQNGSPNNAAYFWSSGLLSSLLDNGPTYLVFFVVAGGKAATLMGPLAKTLEAISLGAVFMGALTYIGSAPNFMVYALARRARVDMPGFFGYMIWSIAVLVPIFIALTFLFLR
jgi:Na+/H+ antiporter NhaD/arsenite permease-like protein